MISDEHRRELHERSAIDPAVTQERGYRTFMRPSNADDRPRQELKRLGIPSWATREQWNFPGLLIPMYRPTGERISHQFKPQNPVPVDGKQRKYASPIGHTNRIDVHPRNRDRIADPTVPLWITEGVKKADSLTSRGVCVVALTGVYNWRSTLGTLGDWEDVPLKGREVTVCFDADARKNPNVLRAMTRLGAWLRSKGCKKVLYLVTPASVNGIETKGADDFFAAGGTLAELEQAASSTPPNGETTVDTFTDARLAEVIAEDVLADQFCWVAGLGWLAWDGRRWEERSDVTVGESVRQYVLEQFAAAASALRAGDQGAGAAVDGWKTMLGASREKGVLSLARGIVERRVDDFDAHPDLLNTQSGVVGLLTGELLPHDPVLLMTKITSGAYRPGYTHPDWEKALEALPEEPRSWYQTRIGQATSGHTTPDGIMPVLQGGGENGKSALTTDGVVIALGDYAAAASPKLFQSNRNEHSTERADLRGQRLLVAEELTEGRAIDVTALKQIQDVGQIKARKVHKDNITFTPSHSLFTTTNYVPVVSETDHGTWRRLALLVFPYTFRKPGEQLDGPLDRRGDPQLKGRIKAGAGGQHDAIVTWAVEGAMRWYADPDNALSVPGSVAADTRKWRAEADRVLGFWDEQLVPDRTACVLTSEMLDAFNDWLAGNGHNAWSKELFVPRFKGHTETKRHGVEEKRTAKPRGLARRPVQGGFVRPQPVPNQARVWVGVRFRTDADGYPDTDADQGADQGKQGLLAEVADPSANFSTLAYRGSFTKGSASSASSQVSGVVALAEPTWGRPACRGCAAPLLAPESRERGTCERCRSLPAVPAQPSPAAVPGCTACKGPNPNRYGHGGNPICPACVAGGRAVAAPQPVAGAASPMDHLLPLAETMPPRICPGCGNAEEPVPPAGFWFACRTCNPDTFTRN